MRQHIPRSAVVVHKLDHVAARLVRRHLLEQLALADQAADSHRAEHLVAAESVEVDAERVEGNREMGSTLCAIADQDRVRLLAHEANDLVDRIDGSDRIRNMIERDDFGLLAEQVTQKIEIDSSIRCQLTHPEPGALSHRQYLPWDEIRVVIEGGNDDLVAARDVSVSPRARDEIQSFRRPAREDQTI